MADRLAGAARPIRGQRPRVPGRRCCAASTRWNRQAATGSCTWSGAARWRCVHGKTSLTIGAEPASVSAADAHRFITDAERGAELVCANLVFEGGARIRSRALPRRWSACRSRRSSVATTVLELLFEEASTQRCGRTALVNRLFEVVLIQVLRQLMEAGRTKGGMLAGLAHPRLRNAIVAMHEAPAKEWSLEDLARVAGMSRSVFATTFRDVLGMTPGPICRAGGSALAQQALLQRASRLKLWRRMSATAARRRYRARSEHTRGVPAGLETSSRAGLGHAGPRRRSDTQAIIVSSACRLQHWPSRQCALFWRSNVQTRPFRCAA